MRSSHYNHQRHARQQAQFFAQVEAERAATEREREQDQDDTEAAYQAATDEAVQTVKEGVWR